MISTFRRFAPFVQRHWRLLAAGNLLALLEIILGLAEPWPLAFLVDHVIGDEPGGSLLGIVEADGSIGSTVAAALAVLAVIVAGTAVTGYLSTRLLNTAGQRIGYDIRRTTFLHLQRLSLGFHQSHPTGDLTTRVTKDVDRVQDLMVDALAVLVPNALLIGGMAIVMVLADPLFAAVALGITPLLAWSIHRSTVSMKRASRSARSADGDVASIVSETLSAIPVVQALGLEPRQQARFDESAMRSFTANVKAIGQQARLGPTVDLSSALARGVVIAIGVQRVLAGQVSVGVVLVFLTYLNKLYSPIKALSKLTFNISRAEASGDRVHGILATRPTVDDLPGAHGAPRFRGELEFSAVTFSYGREPVLDGVDFHVGAGERVAVVGPTGSGKSTLASLLIRFYDPQDGAVRIDGLDLRDITVDSLRSQIAIVLQESVLFHATIRENIWWARPDATDAQVEDVARRARVTEFSERLPMGLDTVLGERGADLSGGQRQRIAIARAMLRDCPILLLDEPTSALDAESETLVIEALEELMEGRTTLIIAHRLSTVRRADRIMVLERGRVVESGSHDELIASKGLYAYLTELQSGGDAVRPEAIERFAVLDDGSVVADLGVERSVVGVDVASAFTDAATDQASRVEVRSSTTEAWRRVAVLDANRELLGGALTLDLTEGPARYVRVVVPTDRRTPGPDRSVITGLSIRCRADGAEPADAPHLLSA